MPIWSCQGISMWLRIHVFPHFSFLVIVSYLSAGQTTLRASSATIFIIQAMTFLRLKRKSRLRSKPDHVITLPIILVGLGTQRLPPLDFPIDSLWEAHVNPNDALQLQNFFKSIKKLIKWKKTPAQNRISSHSLWKVLHHWIEPLSSKSVVLYSPGGLLCTALMIIQVLKYVHAVR